VKQVPRPPRLAFKERAILTAQVFKHFVQSISDIPQAGASEKALLDDFQRAGAADTDMHMLSDTVSAVRKTLADSQDYYKTDRYLVGGSGVLDIVLLQVLSAARPIDFPLTIAWVAFAVSAPSVFGFLALGHVRDEHNVNAYWRFHAILAFVGPVGALGALAAFLWHTWLVASLVFTACAAIVFAVYIWYSFRVRVSNHVDKNDKGKPVAPQSTNQPGQPDADLDVYLDTSFQNPL